MVIWKNRKKQKEHCRRISKLGIQKIKENPRLCAKGGSARCKNLTREQQSKFGKLSRIHENEMAKKIEKHYDKLYHPTQVCDRIGVKGKKIFFIEIKQKGKKLTKKQEEFKRIVKNNFILLK